MSCSYCILPFIHFHVRPDGEVAPCCISKGFDVPVNLNSSSIENTFNSEQMKALRLDMLNDKKNKVCNICYQQEELSGNSPRIDANSTELWKTPKVNDDGSVEPEFQFIDIRFSNLCNFKCRMCNYHYSSGWHEINKIISPDQTSDTKIIKLNDNLFEELKQYIKYIKKIYFAGGEPLIMPEHYQLLNYLHQNMEPDENNKRKLEIYYNTNLSVIKYNEQSLLELWQGFHKVDLSISCDGIGKIGEYQRVGFKHDNFINNLEKIQKYFVAARANNIVSGMRYRFQYTTTIWNIYHIFDFIEFMKSNKFIESSETIEFYHALSPNYATLNNLKAEEKDKATKFIEDNLRYLSSEKTKKQLLKIIKHMQVPSDENIEVLENQRLFLDHFHDTKREDYL